MNTGKYLLGTLAALALAAAVIGLICFRMNSDPALHAVAVKRDAMQWLRTDFQLTDGQFAAIRQLHTSYAVTCEEHCRMIQEATRAKIALENAKGDAAALAVADRRMQELRLVCETAIRRHVSEVAGHMSPEAGRRYLALVLPKIADFDHQAVPNLHLDHSS